MFFHGFQDLRSYSSSVFSRGFHCDEGTDCVAGLCGPSALWNGTTVDGYSQVQQSADQGGGVRSHSFSVTWYECNAGW